MAKAKPVTLSKDSGDNRKSTDGVNTTNGSDANDPYEVREFVDVLPNGTRIITRKIVLRTQE